MSWTEGLNVKNKIPTLILPKEPFIKSWGWGRITGEEGEGMLGGAGKGTNCPPHQRPLTEERLNPISASLILWISSQDDLIPLSKRDRIGCKQNKPAPECYRGFIWWGGSRPGTHRREGKGAVIVRRTRWITLRDLLLRDKLSAKAA